MVLNFGQTLFGDRNSRATLLKNRTSFWSITGGGFLAPTEAVTYTREYTKITNTSGSQKVFYVEVILPDKAVVISVTMYGTGNIDWAMRYSALDSAVSFNMATGSGAAPTTDTSIREPVIDNSIRKYVLAAAVSDTKAIEGVKIIYTKT